MTFSAHLAAVSAAFSLLVAGCGVGASPAQPGPSPSEFDLTTACGKLVRGVVDDLQTYVDAHAGMTVQELALREEPPGDLDLDATMLRFRERSREMGCPQGVITSSFAPQLRALRTDGQAAEAVAENLRQSILGAPGDGRFTDERTVVANDDLAEILGRAGEGATVVLEPGEHRLDAIVVLDRSVTIRGAGRDRSRIVSSAEGAALTSVGDSTLTIEGITIAHEGDAAASPIVIRSTSYDIRDSRFTGGRADDEGLGGSGMVIGTHAAQPLPASQHGPPARVEVAKIENVEFVNNAGGGLAVVGTAAPTLEQIVARGNGACGVCFVGAEGGMLRASTLSGNRVGISVGSVSRPHLRDNDIEANTEVGISFDGNSAGTVDGNRIVGNGGTGLLVSASAAPTIEANEVRDHDRVGIALGGQSRAQVRRNDLVDNDIGIQVADEAAPTVVTNDVSGEGRAALLLAGSSSGEVRANTCAGTTQELVLIDSAGDPGDNDCEVVDQRD